jgi:hypothetical protein
MRVRTLALAIAGVLAASLPLPARENSDRTSCSVEGLPASIQGQLKADFASWRIQEAKDLSSSARERWASTKPSECPGIAVGEFETVNSAYAVLLVPVDNPDKAYRFLVFGGSDGQPHHKLVEQWDGGGAANYFIQKTQIDHWFNKAWKLKLHVTTNEGILFVDAGEAEYEADVYFWARGDYQHQWVDD